MDAITVVSLSVILLPLIP